MKTIKALGLVGGLLVLVQAQAPAQSFLNYTGGVYTQNFNSLVYSNNLSVTAGNPVTLNAQTYYFSNTNLDFAAAIDSTGPTNNSTGGLALSGMSGWYAVGSVTTRYGAHPGDQTQGGIISFGGLTSANRALGLGSANGSGITTFGLKLKNNTGADINFFTLSFVGELWRQQTTAKTLTFGYLVSNASDLPTSGTTAIGSFGFAAGAAAAVDGTSAGNQTNISVGVSLSTACTNGGSLWLTWQINTAAGNAQQLAIDNLTFAVCPVPAVAAPSVSSGTTVCSGSSVTFTSNATGGMPPYTFQWKKNGANIGSATSSNYTGVSGTDFVNADQISVAVGSACGSTPSNSPAVTMTVTTTPSAPAASAATSVGTTLFSANWNTVSGATGYRLDVASDAGFSSFVSGYNDVDAGNVTTTVVSGLNPSATYYYRVRAYNACFTSSNSGTITVTTASGCIAAVAATPVASPGATNCIGTTLTLTETPSAGTAPFSYLWKKDGAPIAGATNAILQIAGLSTNDTGHYTCDVAAQCNAVTNTSPQLIVTNNALPTITLSGSPVACGGATNAGVFYSGTTSSPDQYAVTWDSAAHTAGFLDVGYTGLLASPVTLTTPGAAVAGTYNGTLTVKKSSTGCVSSNYAFSVTVNANPTITTQPIPALVAQGSNVTFTVATSASSPSYQWQVNTNSSFVNVTGSGATFTTAPTTADMNGAFYRCLVTDGTTGCQTTSVAAKLTVTSPFTAGNLVVFAADSATNNNTTCSIIELSTNAAPAVQTINLNGTSGSTALRVSGSAATTCLLANSDDGAYIAFTGANTTNAAGNVNTVLARGVGTFDYTGKFALKTTYTGVSGNQTRCATSLDDVHWIIGDQAGIYTNGATAVVGNAAARGVKSFGGTLYVLQQDTTATVVSTVSADGKTLTPLNGLTFDNLAVDFHLVSSGANGTTYDVLYILERDGSTGYVLKYSLVSGVWTPWPSGPNFSFYPTGFGGVGICAAQNGSGATLYVTTGDGTNTANSVMRLIDTSGWNADITIGSAVSLYTAAAGTMKGIAFAPISASPCTPAILSDPVPQIVGNGSNAGFSIDATGTGLTFQWQRNKIDVSNGGTIAGATASNLNLTGITLADSDTRWRCVVFSSSGCSNVSATARLVVNTTAPAQAFAPSNLVLEVVGDGANELSGAATAVRILELTTNGAVMQNLILQNSATTPTAAPFNMMASGTAGSDGNLTRSADGRFIIVPGYNGTPGEANISGSNEKRTVGVLSYDSSTNVPYALNIGNDVNFRGATSLDGTNFWVVGQNSTDMGLVYFNSSSVTPVLLSSNNCRTVKIFSNQLYVVSGSGSPGRGIFAISSGLPTSGTPVWNLVITNGTQSASPFNFEFNPATNICYLTDDGATTNFNGGGIQKYTNSTTTGWSLAYIITNGCTKGNGAYGLAVDWSGANPVLYATTAASNSNRVIRIVDDAGSLSTAQTIYTPASDFYYLRGLVFAPTQPAGPACTPPTIDSDPTPQVVTVPGPAAFTVGASGTALTYRWQKNGADVGDGGTITGATTPVITLNGIDLADSGSSWRCGVISSGACSNTSQAATLTVYTPFQAWQIQYFGSTNAVNAAANADVTGTGQNNLFKFVAGLNPTNATSVFSVSARSVSNKIDVTFKPIASGRAYTPQFSTNLSNWLTLTTFTGPLTNGSQVTLTDTNALPARKFYRINISLP